VNPRKKACISLDSFGRIGTFQWVTANPNKKIFSRLNSRSGLQAECLKPGIMSVAPLDSLSPSQDGLPNEIAVTHASGFSKKMTGSDGR
jgi:hypothetical protein